MVAPLGVVVVAWDYDRLASLGGTTAVVVCAEVFRRFGGRRAAAWMAAPVGVLVFVQLSDPYSASCAIMRASAPRWRRCKPRSTESSVPAPDRNRLAGGGVRPFGR